MRRATSRSLGVVLALAVMAFSALTAAGCGAGGSSDGSGGATTLNIAVVANPDMERMEELAPKFEAANPKIKLKFTTLDENTLRDKLNQAIATGSGLYDVAMVGVYEVPIWAKNGWIADIHDRAAKTADYDVDDLLPNVRDALSYNGRLSAVPFYAESSFMMYRKDLFEKAGLTMPESPTWEQIAGFAQKLNDPQRGVAGICLRGQAGWGSMLGPLATAVHAYGGHFYDQSFRPTLTSPEFERATSLYVNMVRKYGERGATSASFPECLSVFSQGKAAMWYDATVAASTVTDPKSSKVADDVGFARAPRAAQDTGGWLWSWALAMVKTSKNQDAAWKFLSWATSKSYMKLVAEEFGANLIPPGTRKSTYELPEYREAAAAYADLTLEAIQSARTSIDGAAAAERSFYVAIPEWQDAGTQISQQITGAIAGQASVASALANAQKIAQETATSGGYQR
jgi:sorbitol/mannitol transport system substrate-binding protein